MTQSKPRPTSVCAACGRPVMMLNPNQWVHVRRDGYPDPTSPACETPKP